MQLPKIYFSYKTKRGRTIVRKNLTKRRMTLLLASAKFKDCMLEGELRFVYGKQKCASGCVCTFDNDMKSKNINNIKWGLNAFYDKDLFLK